MSGTRPHYRLPSTDQVTNIIAETRAVTARSLELLRMPRPDTFAGRKTQEPFPTEDELTGN